METKTAKLFTFLLVAILLTGTALALSEEIDIIKDEVTPQPVEPGNDLTASISVYNKGGAQDGLTVELVEEFPFVIKSSSRDLEQEFSLCAGCKIENSYYLTIDPTAFSGVYKMDFFVKQAGASIKKELDVEIKGKPEVIFEVVEPVEGVTSNSEFNVLLKLSNKGTGVARNIKLISTSGDFASAGTNLMFIDEVAPGESTQLDLVFITGSSLSKDVRSLPLNIEYEDHEGNSHTSSQDINVKVVNEAKLSLKEVKITPAKLKPGDEATIQVRIENIGEGDAENIKLVLESGIEGNKDAYLGRLESDDDSPAFFSGKIPSSGEITDTLTVTYEDDLGQHGFEEDIRYTVRGVSITSMIISGLLLVVVVLSVLLFFVWFYQRCKCYLKGTKCEAKMLDPVKKIVKKK